MRSFVLSLTASLALAGAAYAQSSHTASTAASAAHKGASQASKSQASRSQASKSHASKTTSASAGTTHDSAHKGSATKTKVAVRKGSVAPTVHASSAPAKSAVHKASVGRSVPRPSKLGHRHVHAAGFGGFLMTPPPPPPPLDTTSPRTLSLVNVNTGEALSLTYWADGSYRRDALDKLNHFLRDTHTGQETEMDPLLFDVLWHTTRIVQYSGPIEVFSAFRSPTTNAWLASVQRGVASDSQHMNGNAMDIRFPGVPVFQIRQAARSLGMGGVGFYPHSGFVHIDTGSVRYW